MVAPRVNVLISNSRIRVRRVRWIILEGRPSDTRPCQVGIDAVLLPLREFIGIAHVGGRIIAQGTPEELRASNNPVVVQFLSGSVEGPIRVM